MDQQYEPVWISRSETEELTNFQIKLLMVLRILSIHQNESANKQFGHYLVDNQCRALWVELQHLTNYKDTDKIRKQIFAWNEEKKYISDIEKRDRDKAKYISLVPWDRDSGPTLITATEAAIFDWRCLRVLATMRIVKKITIKELQKDYDVGHYATLEDKIDKLYRVLDMEINEEHKNLSIVRHTQFLHKKEFNLR